MLILSSVGGVQANLVVSGGVHANLVVSWRCTAGDVLRALN